MGFLLDTHMSQPLHHALVIVSRDSAFAAYPVERLWT